jgi:putative transposase
MHLTLKIETTKPAGRNFLQQQAKFDDFIACFNNERPHQALNMRYPAERYVPSTRPYTGLPNVDYPFHDRTVTVTTCGRICFNRQKINLSTVFAGQSVGIKQVSEQTSGHRLTHRVKAMCGICAGNPTAGHVLERAR